MANEHLLDIQGTNNELPISLEPSVLACDNTMSGLVPDGDYRLRCVSSAWKPKNGGGGVNLAVQYIIESPVRVGEDVCKGVRISAWHGAPIGDPETETFQKAQKRFGRIAASFLSCLGRLDEVKAAGTFKLAPKAMIGKLCCAHLVTEKDDRGQERSRIAFYLSLADYMSSREQEVAEVVQSETEPAPVPAKAAPAKTEAAKPEPAKAEPAPAPEQEPAKAAPAKAAKPAKANSTSKVEDMLGL